MRTRSTTGGSRTPSHRDGDVTRSASRKTTNDGDMRRTKSNIRSTSRASAGAAGSKERVRSKERKSTALSANSGRTHKSQTSTEEDSADSDVDVDNVPFHLRKAVPLHLVEARILKKSEKSQPSSPTALVTEVKRRVAHQNVEPDVEVRADGIYDPAPNDQVIVRTRVICALLLVFFLWCAAVIPLLVVHVLTFYLRLGPVTHRENADALFGKLEANVAQELAPALNMVFMLRTQASMGLFNVSNPYEAITRSMAGTVQESKQMQYVQIVGASEHMLILRPGNLHYVPIDEDGDGLIDRLIEPDQMRAEVLVQSDNACEGQHQFLCFMEGEEMLNLQMVPLPARHVTGSWYGPEFLLRSKENEILSDPNEYPFVIRFLGLVNVTEGLAPRIDPNQLDPFGRPLVLPAEVGLDVALSLERFEAILQEVTPEGGSAYLFMQDGSILAGTGWSPMAVSYFKYEQTLEYEKIWELPTEWSQELTAEDVASGERFEFYTSNSDLVVVKSLGDTLTDGSELGSGSAYLGAAVQATSRAALRVLVVVPRDVAVAPLLTLFVDMALGVVIAPFATGGLVCIIAIIVAIVNWCRERCKPPVEEDPYLWKFEDDDDD